MQFYTVGDLEKRLSEIQDWARRTDIKTLEKYINDENCIRILSLCGLRRTGKTTIIYHALSDMPVKKREQSIYIVCQPSDTFNSLLSHMKNLEKKGIKYFFIDEITAINDFIDLSAILADGFTMRGIKIVLSGTDSLGFIIAEAGPLYDRDIPVRTTWIPWREYRLLMDTESYDEYIKSGGILHERDEQGDFASTERMNAYIKTSICDNAINSLDNHKDGARYGILEELRDKGPLKDIIARVIADDTHRFIARILRKKYKSYELNAGFALLQKDADQGLISGDILDLDLELVLKNVEERIGIIDDDQNRRALSQPIIDNIKQYLCLMDVFMECPQAFDGETRRHLLVQPGLRWAQTLAVFDSLEKDKKFISCLTEDREHVFEKLGELVIGKIMEDNIIIDTHRTLKNGYNVFPYHFNIPDFETEGEFDLVIFNKNLKQYDALEIKHTTNPYWEQAKHLRNNDYILEMNKFFYNNRSRLIIYSGESYMEYDDIIYLNVENYLENLPVFEEWLSSAYAEAQEKRNIADQYLRNYIACMYTLDEFVSLINCYANDDNRKRGIPFQDWLNESIYANHIDTRFLLPPLFELEIKDLPVIQYLNPPDQKLNEIMMEVGFCELMLLIQEYSRLPRETAPEFINWLEGEDPPKEPEETLSADYSPSLPERP